MKKGVDYLHGILRLREHASVILAHQSHALILKPSHCVIMREGCQDFTHQLIASRINLLQITIASSVIKKRLKGISKVTPSASCYRYLCQRLGLLLIYCNVTLWTSSFQFYRTEATSRTGSYYGNPLTHLFSVNRCVNCCAMCHITMPAVTDTLSECLVPYCGISIHPSHISTTSCLTPFTSFPITMA